ncbi:hypothetical protein ACTWPY_001497 [Enterobacter asburiae]
MKIYYSPSLNGFLLEKTAEDYQGHDLIEITEAVYDEFMAGSTTKKMVPGANGPAWEDLPPPTNAELLKKALLELSSVYQDDIEKLNRAWLSAAVNYGVNETAKKDVVLAQINARKTQYASDRAEIIAQYP